MQSWGLWLLTLLEFSATCTWVEKPEDDKINQVSVMYLGVRGCELNPSSAPCLGRLEFNEILELCGPTALKVLEAGPKAWLSN